MNFSVQAGTMKIGNPPPHPLPPGERVIMELFSAVKLKTIREVIALTIFSVS